MDAPPVPLTSNVFSMANFAEADLRYSFPPFNYWSAGPDGTLKRINPTPKVRTCKYNHSSGYLPYHHEGQLEYITLEYTE